MLRISQFISSIVFDDMFFPCDVFNVDESIDVVGIRLSLCVGGGGAIADMAPGGAIAYNCVLCGPAGAKYDGGGAPG